MNSKFKVGDKVIPVSKSVYGVLASSHEWKASKEQGFMYIVGDDYDRYICSRNNNDRQSGDYFLEEDLVPYIEDTNPMPELKAGMVARIDYTYMGTHYCLLVSPSLGVDLNGREFSTLQSPNVNITEIFEINANCGFSEIKQNLKSIWKRKADKDIKIEKLERDIKEKQRELEELRNENIQ